jgi:hypothetical protein
MPQHDGSRSAVDPVTGRTQVSWSSEGRPPGEKGRVCPACGSTRLATIVYGKPSSDVLQECAAGPVVLGGMQERVNSPQWYCRECDQRWPEAKG